MAYVSINHIRISSPLIITYNGIENAVRQQNTIFDRSNRSADIPDTTFALTEVRGCVNDTVMVVPNVRKILNPPKIVTNHCMSAYRQNEYSPKAISALIARAMIAGTIFTFMMILFYNVGDVGGIGGAAGANNVAKSGRLLAGSHAAIP